MEWRHAEMVALPQSAIDAGLFVSGELKTTSFNYIVTEVKRYSTNF